MYTFLKNLLKFSPSYSSGDQFPSETSHFLIGLIFFGNRPASFSLFHFPHQFLCVLFIKFHSSGWHFGFFSFLNSVGSRKSLRKRFTDEERKAKVILGAWAASRSIPVGIRTVLPERWKVWSFTKNYLIVWSKLRLPTNI